MVICLFVDPVDSLPPKSSDLDGDVLDWKDAGEVDIELLKVRMI